MLYFSFYEPVSYLVDETTFPSKSKELHGWWFGVSENVGHFMTILEWIPVLVDTVPLIVWLVYVVLMKNFRCCQRIQQRQSYKLRVHGVNPQSPLKV
jgi:hypothetical protein